MERKMEKECAKISMKILGDKTLKQKLVTQVERVTDNFKRFTNRFLEHISSLIGDIISLITICMTYIFRNIELNFVQIRKNLCKEHTYVEQDVSDLALELD